VRDATRTLEVHRRRDRVDHLATDATGASDEVTARALAVGQRGRPRSRVLRLFMVISSALCAPGARTVRTWRVTVAWAGAASHAYGPLDFSPQY
jgi:hypothetical protein